MYGLRSHVDTDTISSIEIDESANREIPAQQSGEEEVAAQQSDEAVSHRAASRKAPMRRNTRASSAEPATGSSFDQFQDPPRVSSRRNRDQLRGNQSSKN